MTAKYRIVSSLTFCTMAFVATQTHAAIETITENYFDETYSKTVAAGDTLIYQVPDTASEGGAIKVFTPTSSDPLIDRLVITTGENATVVFQNNSAVNYGGAIRSSHGNVVLQNTVFVNNKVTGYDGGAIYVTGNFTLNIDDNRILSSYGNTSARPSDPNQSGFLFLSGGDKNYPETLTTATFNIGKNSIYMIGDRSKSYEDALYSSYGHLTKTGAGKLVINSNGDWGGVVTVAEGILEINAQWYFNGTGSLEVQSGATLSGTGVFSSPINLHRMATIRKGGILSPGSGIGTITFADLTLEGGSILKFENGDLISVGNLYIDASASSEKILIDLSGFGAAELTDYVLFEADTIIGSLGDLSDYFEFSDNVVSGALSVVDGNIVFSGTVIPEPALCALLFGAAAFASAACRRKKQA